MHVLYIAVVFLNSASTEYIVLTPALYDGTVYMVMMCKSIQSVLVVVCVVTLSHHIQLGKSQNDGKLVLNQD